MGSLNEQTERALSWRLDHCVKLSGSMKFKYLGEVLLYEFSGEIFTNNYVLVKDKVVLGHRFFDR